ncbi:uncharacterized protein [Physcomitrium patens]|uniref:Ubiquitin-like protease family profile domain-containing protein n=1 Tax=Physcomitrium patens TaxID=3218 RepID=A0A2K1J2I1_PHYPA|nr:ubiquitin-like-specific protease 1D isoform X1 [Physcomitrium patens]PNR35735.1 hypothetical protein PHYPA_021585 [Physcomitrium patens]|eukprot:XP_024401364.1 ubiquitin-like-specific protease 1D isoform X1 [Physcomitrella patens]
MSSRRVTNIAAVCSFAPVTGKPFVAIFVDMIGHYPSVDMDNSDDDSDDLEIKVIGDSMTEKLKDFSDTQLDDEIEKYKEYVYGKKSGLKLSDEGAKFTIHLQKLQREKDKRARLIKRSQAAPAPEPQDTQRFDEFCGGPCTIGDGQATGGTSSTIQPGSLRGFGISSTVKTDSFSNNIRLHSPTSSAPHEDFGNGKITVSSETTRQFPSPEKSASSADRATRVSSGEQAGPSCRELSTPNQFDKSEGCSICKKTSNLKNVAGKDGLYCSVCRRKQNTPDPSFQLDGDRKTPAARTRSSRKREREADVGRTPDTAMQIDSSDDEIEKTRVGVVERPRRMGLRSSQKARMEGYRVAYPSRTDSDAVEILPEDIDRLNPMEFLNDTIIDFYIKYIQRDEFLSPEERQRFHFFNSFFYKKLSEVVSLQKKKGGADFSKLRKWTRGTNIFEKDYLFVPIHDKLHWSLAIICHPGWDKGTDSERCIIHLDSMSLGHDSQRVFRLLKSYLVAEWKHSVEAGENEADECIHTVQKLKADDIPCKKVPVPLQENESDCGLFLLHYIQKFAECAPKTMKLVDLEGSWETVGVFGVDWFLPTEASNLRTSIQEHLQRLFDQEILEHAKSACEQVKEEDRLNEDVPNDEGRCELMITVDRETS